MPNHWIVTCNPDRWRFFGYLAEGRKVADIPAWSVVQRLDDLAEGDDIALWVTGKKRGIYTIGKVIGPPELGYGDFDWVTAEDRHKQRHFVPLEFFVDLSKRPISGDELKRDPGFSDSTVVTFPRGANPHQLDNRQWRTITKRVFR